MIKNRFTLFRIMLWPFREMPVERHLHRSPHLPRYFPLRRPAARDPFCQPASPHLYEYPDSDTMRTPCTVQTQELIAISMLKLLQQAFYNSS